MELFDFFIKNKKCNHAKVSPQDDFAYCPDCGELIENRWFITRCSCCGIKVKAIYKNGEIIAEEKFCHNCGGKTFEPELVSKINCIDINYAVLVKTVVNPKAEETTQCWFESEPQEKLKFLTQT